MLRILMKILSHASAKKKDDERVSDFALSLIVFKGYSSKGVKTPMTPFPTRACQIRSNVACVLYVPVSMGECVGMCGIIAMQV